MADGKRVLIVGGVAGGASAAARIRRLSEAAEVVIFERGEHISFANCGLPYHIGNVIHERDRLLVQTPQQMKKRFRVDVRTRSLVLGVDRSRQEITVRDLADDREYTERYDTLILSPGAEPVRPNIPGAAAERVFTLRSMADMDAIKRVIDAERPTRALIVGGGYIGLEMTEALVERGLHVTLVELEPQVMGTLDAEMAFPLHQELRARGVELLLSTSVMGIQEAGNKTLDVQLSSGELRPADLVVLAVGVRPEVNLAREAGLAIGAKGGIVVNEQMQTSDPNIYAVGDAVEVVDFIGGHAALIPLAGPANRQGRVAANNICGRRSAYPGTQGTAICKVFGLAAAVTGLNEKNLKRAGKRYEKIYVHPAHHAGYYPGASQISLKLLFDPESGKILGAQGVGARGVDKRIDVIATAMRAGMTVQELQDVELCYAPPFGSAKDPVNYAAFVAANVIAGDMPVCHADEVVEPGNGKLLVDVRSPMEVKAGTIPGAVNVPVDDLRDRLSELPRDKELLVFCQVGLRGYLACRILSQAGFKCRNLTGGYKTWCAARGDRPRTAATPARELTSDTGEQSS